MSEELERGRHLRYALSRNTSRGMQIGCTFLIGLVLATPGIIVLMKAREHDEKSFVVWAVGGAFTLVAALLFYSAVHQMFALATPQTVVECDADKFTRNGTIRLYFGQPGPADFESLRANLVGEETWHTGSGKQRRRHVNQLGTFNIFDSGPFVIEEGMPAYERTVSVTIPDLPHARADRREQWQLEVWGKVRGRADFQHVYPVTVL
jgi:hypothetical protein